MIEKTTIKLIRTGCLFAAAVLCILSALLSSGYYFNVGTDLNFVSAQQQPTPSESSTSFKEWYEEQKENEQIINPLSVKIESPAKGQEVPSDQNLTVSGISSDNSTSDCNVSVIVNDVRPYQPAVASGTGGTDDYSAWSFVITPEYAPIREGPDNKITSKLECTPDLNKWYSVNVTGVDTTTTTTTTNVDTEGLTIPFLSSPSSPITLGSDDVQGSGPAGNTTETTSIDSEGNPPGSILSISLDVVESSGGEQTIEASALDGGSSSQIESAVIELELTDAAGNIIDEFSDDDGDISYIVQEETGGVDGIEELTATVQATAAGYEPESETTTFDVIEQDMSNTSESDDIIDDDENSDTIDDSVDNNFEELFE